MSDDTRDAHIARGCPVCMKRETCYFRGRDAETLTRDELLVAYRHSVDELESNRRTQRADAEMDALFASTRAAMADARKAGPNDAR